jgi:glutamate decarboxylase
MNAAVQVCWEKAARYLEVEERFVFFAFIEFGSLNDDACSTDLFRYWYCTKDRYVYDPKEIVDLVDENTIMVCSILGTT